MRYSDFLQIFEIFSIYCVLSLPSVRPSSNVFPASELRTVADQVCDQLVLVEEQLAAAAAFEKQHLPDPYQSNAGTDGIVGIITFINHWVSLPRCVHRSTTKFNY